jgi:hypothetical protein
MWSEKSTMAGVSPPISTWRSLPTTDGMTSSRRVWTSFVVASSCGAVVENTVMTAASPVPNRIENSGIASTSSTAAPAGSAQQQWG